MTKRDTGDGQDGTWTRVDDTWDGTWNGKEAFPVVDDPEDRTSMTPPQQPS